MSENKKTIKQDEDIRYVITEKGKHELTHKRKKSEIVAGLGLWAVYRGLPVGLVVGGISFAAIDELSRAQYPDYDPNKPAEILDKQNDVEGRGEVGLLPTALKGVPIIAYPKDGDEGGYTFTVGQRVQNGNGDIRINSNEVDVSEQVYNENSVGDRVVPDNVELERR